MPYRTTRRNFLQGGCATALAFWLRRAEADLLGMKIDNKAGPICRDNAFGCAGPWRI